MDIDEILNYLDNEDINIKSKEITIKIVPSLFDDQSEDESKEDNKISLKISKMSISELSNNDIYDQSDDILNNILSIDHDNKINVFGLNDSDSSDDSDDEYNGNSYEEIIRILIDKFIDHFDLYNQNEFYGDIKYIKENQCFNQLDYKKIEKNIFKYIKKKNVSKLNNIFKYILDGLKMNNLGSSFLNDKFIFKIFIIINYFKSDRMNNDCNVTKMTYIPLGDNIMIDKQHIIYSILVGSYKHELYKSGSVRYIKSKIMTKFGESRDSLMTRFNTHTKICGDNGIGICECANRRNDSRINKSLRHEGMFIGFYNLLKYPNIRLVTTNSEVSEKYIKDNFNTSMPFIKKSKLCLLGLRKIIIVGWYIRQMRYLI